MREQAMDEMVSLDPKYNSMGKASFDLLEVDRDDDGYIVSAATLYGKDTKNLAGRMRLVTRKTSIQIVFDYPLHNPVTLTFMSETGFTQERILQCIREGYTRIYREEEATVANPVSQVSMNDEEQMLQSIRTAGGGLLNRPHDSWQVRNLGPRDGRLGC